ncbi:MAG: hypothetical protein A2Z47_04135 [Thermodesulfovibrio sp. RBG_19FT_COMBO_42_12]|nr:MAG: hypothetical protein A2Z47_04135 [Thermodesulfovibrio sp. RBG_19FT_COMBO_42_12]
MNAIEVNNLTKIYRLYNSPKDRLREMISVTGRKYHHEFYALKDVSFSIEKGQTVGIIGKNGSGKSTLLKVICGVLQPSGGSVKVNGRISSLLELGAGFNPEFTGRENVYMNGALMGFSREAMESRFPEIEAFADIGEYIDQPTKSYSSGMLVRLAFAAAINVDPDILIVDEALAVGDMFFQTKCTLKIKKIISKGVTLLFVSHNPDTILSLCKTGIWLKQGEIIQIGDAKDVSSGYFKQFHAEQNINLQKQQSGIEESLNYETASIMGKDHLSFMDGGDVFIRRVASRSGNDPGWIRNVIVIDSNGNPTNGVEFKDDFLVRIYLEAKKDMDNYCIGFRICDNLAIPIAHSNNIIEKLNLPDLKEGDRYIYEFGVKNIFSPGNYSVMVSFEKIVIPNLRHIIVDNIEGGEFFEIKKPIDLTNWFYSKVFASNGLKVYDAGDIG